MTKSTDKPELTAAEQTTLNERLFELIKAGADAEEVTRLIDRGAEVNVADRNGYTPLMHAAGGGYTKIIQMLIQKGANVNVVDKYNSQTPLIWAATGGHTKIMQMLIGRGANVDAADRYGDTPLMRAATAGHTEAAEMLIANGANVNVVDERGTTPLIKAAGGGHTKIMQMLIENGSNVNAANQYAETPLMIAAHYGHTKIMHILIENGANVNARDDGGRTALMIAHQVRSQERREEIVNLITEHQERLNHLAEFLKSEYIDRAPNRYTQAQKDLFLKQCDSYNESNIKDALMMKGLSATDVTKVYNDAKKEANDQKWNALLGGIDKERKTIHKGAEKPLLSHIAGENILHALPIDVLSIATQFLSEGDNKKARNDIRKATLRAPKGPSR